MKDFSVTVVPVIHSTWARSSFCVHTDSKIYDVNDIISGFGEKDKDRIKIYCTFMLYFKTPGSIMVMITKGETQEVQIPANHMPLRRRQEEKTNEKVDCHFYWTAAAVGLMLTATGAWIKSRQMSVAIIGGADGPTSIFVAGKINGAAFMEAGAILVAGGLGIGLLLFLVFRRKRK